MESGQELNLPNVEKKETREARDGGMSGGETGDGEMKTPNTAMMRPEKSGAKKGMIAGLVCLTLLAVAGCAFGAYGMLTKDSEIAKVKAECAGVDTNVDADTKEEIAVVTCPDGSEVEVTTQKIIDNNVAQNIVNPYLGWFNYISNILDYEFSEDSKVQVAFDNIRPSSIGVSNINENAQQHFDFYVSYNELNEKYQEMFGNYSELEKRDYGVSHADRFSYNTQTGLFDVNMYAGGGAGLGMFSVVKDAYYSSDEKLEINVYHDIVPVCGAIDSNYCLEVGSGLMTTSIEEANVRELIENYASKIPVYKMIFTPNAGHYVLSDIQKQ